MSNPFHSTPANAGMTRVGIESLTRRGTRYIEKMKRKNQKWLNRSTSTIDVFPEQRFSRSAIGKDKRVYRKDGFFLVLYLDR